MLKVNRQWMPTDSKSSTLKSGATKKACGLIDLKEDIQGPYYFFLLKYIFTCTGIKYGCVSCVYIRLYHEVQG